MRAFSLFLLFTAATSAYAQPAAPPVPGEDWRLVATDEEREVGRVLAFAESSTISRSGNQIGFWLEFRIEKPVEGGDGFRGYVSADCTNYTYGSVELSRLAGTEILEAGGTESGLTAAPGTNMRVVLDNVCKSAFETGEVNPIAFARGYFARQP